MICAKFSIGLLSELDDCLIETAADQGPSFGPTQHTNTRGHDNQPSTFSANIAGRLGAKNDGYIFLQRGSSRSGKRVRLTKLCRWSFSQPRSIKQIRKLTYVFPIPSLVLDWKKPMLPSGRRHTGASKRHVSGPPDWAVIAQRKL